MKLQACLLTVGLIVATGAYADTAAQSTEKINFLKKVYADALNEDLMGVDVVKLHGSKELRALIGKRDAIADAHQGDMCEWVENTLIPGQDYDVKAHQIQYTALSNGRIQVRAKNFGQPFKIDFDVKCNAGTCKIADLFNPQSFKQSVTNIVRKGTC
ncbi:hypothetical protein EC844_12365 [Acinetobacter calcoaceticus]|uniref:Nuclear transport factor 2 family protein n=1 Tax=Acinetobacter calcoaceticus TaxID=471 RepID=A0A4R1XI12_ACICA|nr:hypothetical protein EC844_12365 [Acinetobacter calcoaceticus]